MPQHSRVDECFGIGIEVFDLYRLLEKLSFDDVLCRHLDPPLRSDRRHDGIGVSDVRELIEESA